MHILDSVTVMESHWVTSEMVIMNSIIIFAMVPNGSTSNMASVRASAPLCW